MYYVNKSETKYLCAKLSFDFFYTSTDNSKNHKGGISKISNRHPIPKYMAIFHFLKSTSNYVTDVYTSNDVTLVRTWF
jgi:hypothetical protein